MHPIDDPFSAGGGGDRTMIMPRPGGRGPEPGTGPGGAPIPPPQAGGEPPRAGPPPVTAPVGLAPRGRGLNPLEQAAAPLLALVGRLRATISHPSPPALRSQLLGQLKEFEEQARKNGIAQEETLLARYTLCSILDEAVMSTPWGSSSDWSGQSLLSTLHNETWGGEKVFRLLDHCLQNPRERLNLLELLYLCLCLGFEGRFRVLADGRTQRDALRERVYGVIRSTRGEYERELSPRWRGLALKKDTLTQFLPPWVGVAVAAALLLAIFIGFRLTLATRADPVLGHIAALGDIAIAPLDTPPPPAPVIRPKLADFLVDDIKAGRVEVQDLDDKSIVLVRGDGLFASGNDRIMDTYLPLLGRIAGALKKVPGNVLVEGHTDNRPIATLRFPSNWKLSQARAQTVVDRLAADTGEPDRFTAEGRGDTKPIASNDTPEGRARNRRVEITLFAEAAH